MFEFDSLIVIPAFAVPSPNSLRSLWLTAGAFPFQLPLCPLAFASHRRVTAGAVYIRKNSAVGIIALAHLPTAEFSRLCTACS